MGSVAQFTVILIICICGAGWKPHLSKLEIELRRKL